MNEVDSHLTEASTASPDGLRAQILEAAIVPLVEARGAKVPFTMVAQAAGVEETEVSSRFEDPADLLDFAWLHCLASHQSMTLEDLAAANGAEEGIKSVVSTYLSWHEANPAHARLLRRQGLPRKRKAMAKARSKQNGPYFLALLEFIHGGVQAGELKQLSVWQLHAIWTGPASDLCGMWLAGVEKELPTASTEVLGEAAWVALKK